MATAITDNFLLAAGIVLISVLAILRMKEIRLRSAELPAAVSVERPDTEPPKSAPSRVIEFPILEPKPSSPLNGAVEAFDLQLRDQYAPQPRPDQPNGVDDVRSLRRAVMTAAIVGAGVGLALSVVLPRRHSSYTWLYEQ